MDGSPLTTPFLPDGHQDWAALGLKLCLLLGFPHLQIVPIQHGRDTFLQMLWEMACPESPLQEALTPRF